VNNILKGERRNMDGRKEKIKREACKEDTQTKKETKM
jgi:hypothetical protein